MSDVTKINIIELLDTVRDRYRNKKWRCFCAACRGCTRWPLPCWRGW